MLTHIISARDFNKKIFTNFIAKATEFDGENDYVLKTPKILASLFFEPSTRTRLSFESAMIKIGGHCIGFADSKNSSVQKGETIYDTIRTIEGYADVIVIRHPVEGAGRLAAEAVKLKTPIINGGDGANSHISQCLTDIFSIYKRHGRLDNLKIGYMGDLKYGRTVHSLVEALSHFEGNEHHFIAPDPSLDIENDFTECLTERQQAFFHEKPSYVNSLENLDILYVTRLQKERFPDPMEYNRIMKNYQLRIEHLKNSKESFTIMHPLPRNDEIHREVDDHPSSYYFQQAHNGVSVRKALLYSLLVDGGLK